jgi:PilZ domain-containing protein
VHWDKKQMQERRRFERTKVLKAAKIIFRRCEPLTDCVVFNLSIGGAAIQLANAAEIPDEFELTFDAARTLRLCRIAWRSENRIGAMFV